MPDIPDESMTRDFADVMGEPEPTGGYIVSLEEGVSTADAIKALHNTTGAKVASSSDFGTASPDTLESIAEQDVVVLETIRTAVIRPKAQASTAMMTALKAQSEFHDVRPEFYMYAIDDWEERRRACLREALALLVDAETAFNRKPTTGEAQTKVQAEVATEDSTWGLQAIGATTGPSTGRGVKVAVLDTGLDMTHPDFVGRRVQLFDFTGGNNPTDRQGHGTHVAGTIAGPLRPPSGAPRYGVASEVELSSYKVLNDQGRGEEGQIQTAMEAAIRAGNVILNMSLARPSSRTSVPDEVYERIGAAALNAQVLIIAAAGNDSARRVGHIAPVAYPANSKTIMAVAALDVNFRIADFSCGGLIQNGGEIDISGPGVDVFSSTISPRRFASLSGTSMAAPHVAGVAALLAQSDVGLRGEALRDALLRRVRPPTRPARDVGKGCVHT